MMAEAEATAQNEDSLESSTEDADSTPAVVEEGVDGGGGTTRRLCDPFLDRYATMMDHENIASILGEQDHMYVHNVFGKECHNV